MRSFLICGASVSNHLPYHLDDDDNNDDDDDFLPADVVYRGLSGYTYDFLRCYSFHLKAPPELRLNVACK